MLGAKFAKRNILRALSIIAILSYLFFLALAATAPVLIYRHFALPKDEFSIPIHLVPKVVQSRLTSEIKHVGLTELRDLQDMSRQDYKIELELTLPRNDINREFGPFPVKAALGKGSWTVSELNENLPDPNVYSKVERMVTIPYKSNFIEKIDRLTYVFFYLFEFKHEESVITTTLWDNADSPKSKNPHLLITLPDGVWVASSRVLFTVKLRGLKWVLKHFPISSFLFGTLFCFMGEVLVSAIFGIYIYLKISESQADYEARRLQASKDREQYELEKKQRLEREAEERKRILLEEEREKLRVEKIKSKHNSRSKNADDSVDKTTEDPSASETTINPESTRVDHSVHFGASEQDSRRHKFQFKEYKDSETDHSDSDDDQPGLMTPKSP